MTPGRALVPGSASIAVPRRWRSLRVSKQGDDDYACGLHCIATAARHLGARAGTEEPHVRVQQMNETVERRLKLLDLLLHRQDLRRTDLLIRWGLHEVRSVLGEVADHLGWRTSRTRRNHQPQHDSRDRGMDAPVVQRVPEASADGSVGKPVRDVAPVHHEQHGGTTRCCEQPRHLQPVPVEQCDDDDATDVVEDGEGCDEDVERPRHAILEKREHPDAERDVRGHRNGPSSLARLAPVEGKEDRSREHHAADRRDRRQACPRERLQLADGQLPLDLHADDEEEDRHQHVVDQLEKREAADA